MKEKYLYTIFSPTSVIVLIVLILVNIFYFNSPSSLVHANCPNTIWLNWIYINDYYHFWPFLFENRYINHIAIAFLSIVGNIGTIAFTVTMFTIHCINAGLFYFFLRTIKISVHSSFLAFLIFLFNIQTFNQMSMDSLVELTLLTAILLLCLGYICQITAKGIYKKYLFALQLIGFLIGMGSKESFILYVLILACYEIFIRFDMHINWRKLFSHLKYHIIICLIYLILNLRSLLSIYFGENTSQYFGKNTYESHFNLVHIIKNIFSFTTSSVYYPLHDNPSIMVIIIGILIHLALLSTFIKMKDRAKLLFAYSCFILSMLPMLAFSNRILNLYTYIPSLFMITCFVFFIQNRKFFIYAIYIILFIPAISNPIFTKQRLSKECEALQYSSVSIQRQTRYENSCQRNSIILPKHVFSDLYNHNQYSQSLQIPFDRLHLDTKIKGASLYYLYQINCGFTQKDLQINFY